jgi:hypothetical protein
MVLGYVWGLFVYLFDSIGLEVIYLFSSVGYYLCSLKC